MVGYINDHVWSLPSSEPGPGRGIRECPRLGTERASLGRIPPIMGDPPRTGGVKRDGGARQSPWVECLRPIEEQISLSQSSSAKEPLSAVRVHGDDL